MPRPRKTDKEQVVLVQDPVPQPSEAPAGAMPGEYTTESSTLAPEVTSGILATVAWEDLLVSVGGSLRALTAGDPIPNGATFPSGESIYLPSGVAPAAPTTDPVRTGKGPQPMPDWVKGIRPISMSGNASEEQPIMPTSPAPTATVPPPSTPVPAAPLLTAPAHTSPTPAPLTTPAGGVAPAPQAAPAAPVPPVAPAPRLGETLGMKPIVWIQGQPPRPGGNGFAISEGAVIEAEVNNILVGGFAHILDEGGVRMVFVRAQGKLPQGLDTFSSRGSAGQIIKHGTPLKKGESVVKLAPPPVEGPVEVYTATHPRMTGEAALLPANSEMVLYPVWLRSWDPHPGQWLMGAVGFAGAGQIRFIPEESLTTEARLMDFLPVADGGTLVAVSAKLSAVYHWVALVAQREASRGGGAPTPWASTYSLGATGYTPGRGALADMLPSPVQSQGPRTVLTQDPAPAPAPIGLPPYLAPPGASPAGAVIPPGTPVTSSVPAAYPVTESQVAAFYNWFRARGLAAPGLRDQEVADLLQAVLGASHGR